MHQDKFVYLLRTEMPAGGFEDGKEADADMRRELSRRGLGRFRPTQHLLQYALEQSLVAFE